MAKFKTIGEDTKPNRFKKRHRTAWKHVLRDLEDHPETVMSMLPSPKSKPLNLL